MNSGRPAGRAYIRSSYSSKHLVVPEEGDADSTMASKTATANLRKEKQAACEKQTALWNLQQKVWAGGREGGFKGVDLGGGGLIKMPDPAPRSDSGPAPVPAPPIVEHSPVFVKMTIYLYIFAIFTTSS